MQQWYLQGKCPNLKKKQQDTKVTAKTPGHAFANPVGLLQDFHQTSLFTYIAFWMGGWMDGEIFLTFTQ